MISAKSPSFFHSAERVLAKRLPLEMRRAPFLGSPERQRAMRLERDNSVRAVLRVLISHADLLTGKSCLVLEDGITAVPVTVEDIVAESGIKRRTVFNVLAYLKRHGYIISEKQRRKSVPLPGGDVALVCTSVFRTITQKLLAVLGLLHEWASCQLAKVNLSFKFARQGSVVVREPGRVVRRPIPPATPESPPPPPQKSTAPDRAQEQARDAIMRATQARLAAQN